MFDADRCFLRPLTSGSLQVRSGPSCLVQELSEARTEIEGWPTAGWDETCVTSNYYSSDALVTVDGFDVSWCFMCNDTRESKFQSGLMYIWGRLRGIQWDSCRARLQHQRFMTVPPIRRSTRSNRVKDLGRWTRVEVWWVGSFWDFGSDQDTTGGQPLLDGDGDVQNAAWGGQALDPKNHSRPEHRDSSKSV